MPRVTLESIPQSRITDATIRRMYELVDAAKTDARFQKVVYDITNAALPGNWKEYQRELDAVLSWFKGRHDYRRDPADVELLQDVWATLDRKRFDCDDASVFMAAAAEILGSPARFVTVSTRLDKTPCHVYVQAHINGNWLGVDATIPKSYVGWEPADITDKRIWSRKDVGLSGLGELTMRKVGGFSTMWYPDDPNLHAEAKTYADPMRGDMVVSGKGKSYLPVLRVQDPVHQSRTSSGADDYAMPMREVAHPMPPERGFLYPSDGIPRDFDMAQPADWLNDDSALYPQPIAPEEEAMSLLGELTATQQAAANAAAGTVTDMVKTGQVPATGDLINTAIKTAADIYSAKLASRTPSYTPAYTPAAVAKSSSSPWLVPAIAVGGLVLVGLLVARR